MIPLGTLSLFLLFNTGLFGAVFNMVLGLGFLALVAPWFFRWYFICLGLFFGSTQMAQSKEKELLGRLEQLVGTTAASESI